MSRLRSQSAMVFVACPHNTSVCRRTSSARPEGVQQKVFLDAIARQRSNVIAKANVAEAETLQGKLLALQLAEHLL